MTSESIIELVAAHGGISPERAYRATRAILANLGGVLSAAQRAYVGAELPDDLRRVLVDAPVRTAWCDEPVILGASAAENRELTASVCRGLGELLSTSARRVLQSGASPRIAAMLERPARSIAAPRAHRRGNLAEGQPGSLTPISEAQVSAWRRSS